MESLFDEGTGTIINRALQFVVVITAVTGVVAYFMKEYSVANVIKKIFGVLFVAASLINAIYFIIRLFQGNFRVYNITQTAILLFIGTALIRWKLPQKNNDTGSQNSEEKSDG
jgi:hypothetical protein